MRCPLPCLGLAAATLTLPVLAADGDTPLLEVIVTGRAPASLTVPDIDAARAELATVPGGAGVVEAADEQRGRSSTLQDSLGFATGVFVQPRFGAEESRLSIRGSGVQRTFHLRGIRLLQDGVPVNQADGGGDFQVLDPLALEYTEVWRGANALRFGAATLGGAVNFISPTARSPAGAGSRLHFEAGSHGYLRPFASYGAADSQRDGYLAISGFAQEGFREHAEQETWRLSGNWGERLGAGVENRVWIGAVNSNSELPGNLTKAQMRRDPTAAAAGNVALDQQRNFDLFRIADQLTLVKDGARTDFAAYFVHKDLHHPIFQVLHQVSQDAGLSLIHMLEAPLAGRANRLTAGVLASRGRLDDHRWVNLAGHTGNPTAHNEGTAWNLEAFVEN
ncbi:MAG TPA: TonB-dependent receptor plug domain-containing protein, partial [Plasticicumulans sp.]|nr:TonB-dependent receptor plug domain-containing protein [Plasticicumulans sp.]